MTKTIRISAILGAVAALLAMFQQGQRHFSQPASAASNERLAPQMVVDPFWPQPLPNKWILGATIGIAVDSRDHIYIVHRTRTIILPPRKLASTTELQSVARLLRQLSNLTQQAMLLTLGVVQVRVILGRTLIMASK